MLKAYSLIGFKYLRGLEYSIRLIYFSTAYVHYGKIWR